MSVTTNQEGLNHLQWIFDRMVNVHNENPNYDYMIKFKDIITEIEHLEKSYIERIDELETRYADLYEAVETGEITYL